MAVIPAYNEQSRVAEAVRDALLYVNYAVVVDDCSSDQTSKNALDAGAIVLRHMLNRGQGASLQTGTDYALENLKADIIVHFDADGQMQGSDIQELIKPILDNRADIVLGSRFLGDSIKMPLSRKLVLKLGMLFTLCISGIKLTDTHCGFRALSKKSAKDIVITRDRMAHASEILDLIKVYGLRFVECPVTIKYSPEVLAKGQSSWGALVIVKDMLKSKFLDV
ncbi:glycosyltransferase family 2 protein [Candidatus Parcubacteria bacterium]|nr:glycosyltransferase family 2 protein [Candidatus Parcubacteria bacterium]